MPLLNFDLQAGMTAPETSELREAVAKNWQDAFRRDGAPTIDTDPATPAGQLVDAETSYLSQLNSELLFFFSQLNPRTSEGPWQDALAAIYFLTRKIAQPTQAAVICTGLPGTTIPRGAQIRDENNTRYECIQDAVIPESGTMTVLFRNLEAGPIDCPANSLMNFTFEGTGEIATEVDGWEYISNLEAGTIGSSDTRTTVSVDCVGKSDTIIPWTARIEDEHGNLYQPVMPAENAPANAAVIPDNGTVSVLFECTEVGAIPCPVEALSNMVIKGTGSIVTVVPGWDTVRNMRPGVLGWDRESQWDFERRRYDSVAKNSHGAVESLRGAIWDVEDVVDCVVLENPTGTPIEKNGIWIPVHSVAICVYGGADEDIAKAIYLKKDAGCGTGATNAAGEDLPGIRKITYKAEEYDAEYTYKVLQPTETPVEIAVTYHETPSTPSNAEQLIKDAVLSDFYGNNQDSGYMRVGAAQTIFASRFAIAVVKTAGIPDLVNIEIKLGTGTLGGSIVIDADIEPTLSDAGIIVNKLTD